jgi:hypothetical protein
MRRSAALLAAFGFFAVTSFTPNTTFAWSGHASGHGSGRGIGPGWAGGWPGYAWGRHGRFGFFRRPLIAGYGGSYYYGNSGNDPGCIWIRHLDPTPYGPQWRLTPACPYAAY